MNEPVRLATLEAVNAARKRINESVKRENMSTVSRDEAPHLFDSGIGRIIDEMHDKYEEYKRGNRPCS